MSNFWEEHQVGGPYASLSESETALANRSELYPTLYTLMPVWHPGKTILDYGCGPGHDTILFLRNGAKTVWYADLSSKAIAITQRRLELHGLTEKAQHADVDGELPVVDYVHCAGVLHHTEDPITELRKLRGALKKGGEGRVMIYDGGLSPHTQSEVPITFWWTVSEFRDLCETAGWEHIQYVGSYWCPAPWRPDCYASCFKLT